MHIIYKFCTVFVLVSHIYCISSVNDPKKSCVLFENGTTKYPLTHTQRTYANAECTTQKSNRSDYDIGTGNNNK